MIRYRLLCGRGHEFDCWFRDADTCEQQSKNGDVLCPHCGDSEVTKALMTPGLVTSSRRRQRGKQAGKSRGKTAAAKAETAETAAVLSPNMKEKHRQEMLLAAVREYVVRNFDYLGDEFPQEAKRIHRGEANPRNIYGEASDKQLRELNEEGIEVVPLPNKKTS